MKLLKFFIFIFLVTSCVTQEHSDEDFPIKPKIECPKRYVEYCESGRFGEMECICVNRSVLYDQLRDLNGRF